jgi:hypothetical protein
MSLTIWQIHQYLLLDNFFFFFLKTHRFAPFDRLLSFRSNDPTRVRSVLKVLRF